MYPPVVLECAEELLPALVKLCMLTTLDLREALISLGGVSSELGSGRALEVPTSVSDRVLLHSQERGEEARVDAGRKEASSSVRSALITSRSEEDRAEADAGW